MATHPKLENPRGDYEPLHTDLPWWRVDMALCVLDATLRQARSRAGFYRVDHDYVLAVARLIHRACTPVFGLVSSLGVPVTHPSCRLLSKGKPLIAPGRLKPGG